jgi:hypothetical protein
MKATGKKLGESDPGSQDRVVCGGCKKDSSWFSAGMKSCAECRNATYCSRECQKVDWKQHKKSCGKGGETLSGQASSAISTGSSDLDTIDYYNTVAHMVPEAKALAESMNLTLPPREAGLM